jgi:ABC-type Zn uptake system ZnuABC Zn-binding protein ZnuA
MLRPTLIAATLLALVFAACTTNDDGSDGRVDVVTTLPVLADLVRQVGGERVDVTALYPPGADPHTFEPAPRDVAAIARADVVFSNGLRLEGGATDDLINANLKDGAEHVRLGERAVAAGVTVLDLEEDGRIEDDPHLWLSVDNARLYAEAIRDALTAADAEGAPGYEADYDAYLVELDGLDAYVGETLSAVPEERRRLVTTHDAFAYMAAYMGFEVAGFVAESPGQEPGARALADLVQRIDGLGISAVFQEPQLGAEATILQRAAEDSGIEVCTLYSDALDAAVRTYIDLIRHNADELARCLG